MIQIRRSAAIAAMALGAVLMCAGMSRAQSTVTTFNFNDSDLVSDGGARSTTITTSLANAATQGFATGTTVNALSGVPAGNALSILTGSGGGNSNNGNGTFFQFAVNTTGFTNLTFSFASQRSSAAVFPTDQLSYSTTGTGGAFTNFGASFTPPVGSFAATSFDLSSITALNNNPNAVFRLTIDGSANGSSSNNQTLQVDNIILAGVAVPEPGTLGLLGGAGLLPLGAVVRRRHRRRS